MWFKHAEFLFVLFGTMAKVTSQMHKAVNSGKRRNKEMGVERGEIGFTNKQLILLQKCISVFLEAKQII